MMKLDDVKGTSKGTTVLVACRIPTHYKQFMVEHKIGLRELVCKTIDEIKGEEELRKLKEIFSEPDSLNNAKREWNNDKKFNQ